MVDFTATYTDLYQLSMAQVYFLKGHQHHRAVFDYFFRKLPFENGYAIFAGLETVLDGLARFRFDKTDLDYLHHQGFNPQFVEYLKSFHFTGKIYAPLEGDIIFPLRPVVVIEASIIEALLIETWLLNTLNFQTLIATKAARLRQAAGSAQLMEFGLRRAQSMAGYYASRAAFIGGVDATSNVGAAKDFDIPIVGTMSHAYIQSYEREVDAFRDFVTTWPEKSVLLVDTYDTISVGLANAIVIAKEMQARGQALLAIRLDSGDLAILAKKARKMLDKEGLTAVKIIASNQLDERIIFSLVNEKVPIDAFGVGTSLVTGLPDAALDGVYKLVEYNHHPCMKLSENIEKMTIPGKKQVYRFVDKKGLFIGHDLMTTFNETPEDALNFFSACSHSSLEGIKAVPVLQLVCDNGKRLGQPRVLSEIADYAQKRLGQLPKRFKKLQLADSYQVSMSEALTCLQTHLMASHPQKAHAFLQPKNE